MTTKQVIGRTLGALAARASRAAVAWIEQGGETHGASVELLQQWTQRRAEELRKDLDVAEVDRVCQAAVAAYLQAEEQRQAEEQAAAKRATEAEANERQRLAFIRSRRVRFDEPTAEIERPGVPCLALDALGKREAAQTPRWAPKREREERPR